MRQTYRTGECAVKLVDVRLREGSQMVLQRRKGGGFMDSEVPHEVFGLHCSLHSVWPDRGCALRCQQSSPDA